VIVSWSLRNGLLQPGDLDHGIVDAQAGSVQSKQAIGLLLRTKLQAEIIRQLWLQLPNVYTAT
jgi:hypothetical protein